MRLVRNIRWIPLVYAIISLCSIVVAGECDISRHTPPLEMLRKDHPRIFLNPDMVKKIRATILDSRDSQIQDYYQQIYSWATKYVHNTPKAGDWGTHAAKMALVYHITNQPEFLSAAKIRLKKSLEFYRRMDEGNMPVSWYATSRINAICAYDWIYDALTPKERRWMAKEILDHVEAVQPDKKRQKTEGRNTSDYMGGFYGTPSLLWYAGLATLGENEDDGRPMRFLHQGYRLNLSLLDHRSRIAGDDGGLTTVSLGYTLGAYPWAEFNFFHTLKSAFGIDAAGQWLYPAYLTTYMYWNRLPGHRHFGCGDAFHDTNGFPEWQTYGHLSQIQHFYGKTLPEYTALAAWLQTLLKKQRYVDTWPAVPFLLDDTHQSPQLSPILSNKLPYARHFEGIGQVFMRSGNSPDDTYAQFTGGGASKNHKHFDENNFLIFAGGFLALDSGSRPEPGSHLYSYYCRTIAHNCVLIRMEGESMPQYWGKRAQGEPKLPIPNDGGQQKRTGSIITAFETQPEYTYIASDATSTYHPDKCSLMLRQFVFIPPRYFVVFDRVTSKKADQEKTWLLHTAEKPELQHINTIRVESENGRLFSRTLLPREANVKITGGSGRQFLNDGRNWPLPPGYKISNDHPLAGQWRIEVSPDKAAEETFFLHFIEAGVKNQTTVPPDTELILTEEDAGIEFTVNDTHVRLTFSKKGEAAGRITYSRNRQRIEKDLIRYVQKQKGFYGGGEQ